MRQRRTEDAELPSWAARVRDIARAVTMVIGAPDYARYLAHRRAKHPDATPLSREDFARERERARYEGTGSRCC